MNSASRTHSPQGNPAEHPVVTRGFSLPSYRPAHLLGHFDPLKFRRKNQKWRSGGPFISAYHVYTRLPILVFSFFYSFSKGRKGLKVQKIERIGKSKRVQRVQRGQRSLSSKRSISRKIFLFLTYVLSVAKFAKSQRVKRPQRCQTSPNIPKSSKHVPPRWYNHPHGSIKGVWEREDREDKEQKTRSGIFQSCDVCQNRVRGL